MSIVAITENTDEVICDFIVDTHEEAKPTKLGDKDLGAGCWAIEKDTKDVYLYDGTTWTNMYNLAG